jgi:protein-tyrosine kinase
MSRIDEALRRVAVVEPASRTLVPLSLDAYPQEDADRTPEVSDERGGRANRHSGPAQKTGSTASVARLIGSTIAAPRAVGGRTLTGFSDGVEGKVVGDQETSPISVEQYRRLATTLHQLQAERTIKSLMITSALPREGKTLTATNLALTLSESYGRKVLLVDADLRRPSLHEVFRLPNERGLRDGIRADGAALPLIDVSARLTVLPAGRPDPDPLAALSSNRMRSLLQEAASRFDWVILDTPPIGLLPDANLMRGLADGVLFVIGAGSTGYQQVRRAIAELGQDCILGTVLNRVETASMPVDEYYSHYYASDSSSA